MYFLSYNCFSGARESAAESAAKLTPVLECVISILINIKDAIISLCICF